MDCEDLDLKIYDGMPFISLINNISKNMLKYALKYDSEFNILPHGRYLKEIAKTEDITQEYLAQKYGVSKGNIAKSLRKLENEGYIIRKIDENNRRRHIISITDKGINLIEKLEEMHNNWVVQVGISDLDVQTIKKIKQITINSKKLIKED